MVTHLLRIDTEGTVEAVGGDLAELPDQLHQLAGVEFDGQCQVVQLSALAPWAWSFAGATLVGFAHDWGRTLALELNVKAWALYGRSPIVGAFYVGNDAINRQGLRAPLPEPFVAMLTSDVDWVGEELRAAMRDYLAAEEATGLPPLHWRG